MDIDRHLPRAPEGTVAKSRVLEWRWGPERTGQWGREVPGNRDSRGRAGIKISAEFHGDPVLLLAVGSVARSIRFR
jgi:hypothetical protein